MAKVPGRSSSGSDESRPFSTIRVEYVKKPCSGGPPFGPGYNYDDEPTWNVSIPYSPSERAKARAAMKKFNACLEKKHPNFKPRVRRPLEPHRDGPKPIEIPREEVLKFLTPRAAEALKSYNENSGTNYELLLDTGIVTSSLIREGAVLHMNFEARNKDEPDTPLMMFFAEVLEGKNLKVELCECLGPTESLPGKPRNRGCTTCARGIIHHPYSRNFRTGWFPYKDVDEED